jgi:hypothetical protein
MGRTHIVTAIREVIQEHTGARENLHPERVPEWATTVPSALSSSLKMTIKTVEDRLDRPVESDADSARPMGQMLRRP